MVDSTPPTVACSLRARGAGKWREAALIQRAESDNADRSIDLLNRDLHLIRALVSVPAQLRLEFVGENAFALERIALNHAVVDQQRRLAGKERGDTSVVQHEAGQGDVEQDKRRGRYQSRLEADAAADHGVLHGVGDQEDEDDIVRRELRRVALSRDTEERDERKVDGAGAERDLDEFWQAHGWTCCWLLAIGTR